MSFSPASSAMPLEPRTQAALAAAGRLFHRVQSRPQKLHRPQPTLLPLSSPWHSRSSLLSSPYGTKPESLRTDSGSRRLFAHGARQGAAPLASGYGRLKTNETFLSAAIRLFFSHVDVVLVVVGKNESALTPIIYGSGASLVVNPDPGRGQFSSLSVGLREVLNRGRDAAMITLVDRPPVRETR